MPVYLNVTIDMIKKVIGLSGVAGCGKDLFCKILLEESSGFKRFSLADKLKKDLREELKEDYGIDILDCSREEKDKVRPRLVEYGLKKRRLTAGRYWTTKLTSEILNFKKDVCITDIRYDEYDADELFWLNKELGGVLLHISKFYKDKNNNKIFHEAANEEERQNDPRLKANADYVIEWPIYQGSEEEIESKIRSHV